MTRIKRLALILGIAGMLGGTAGAASIALQPAPEASAHTYYEISCYSSVSPSGGQIRPWYHGYPYHIPGKWRYMTAGEYWTYCW